VQCDFRILFYYFAREVVWQSISQTFISDAYNLPVGVQADSRRDTAAITRWVTESILQYTTVDFYNRVFPRQDQLHAAACMSVCLSVCPSFWPVQTQ